MCVSGCTVSEKKLQRETELLHLGLSMVRGPQALIAQRCQLHSLGSTAGGQFHCPSGL